MVHIAKDGKSQKLNKLGLSCTKLGANLNLFGRFGLVDLLWVILFKAVFIFEVISIFVVILIIVVIFIFELVFIFEVVLIFEVIFIF